jgi:hypothetical protein
MHGLDRRSEASVISRLSPEICSTLFSRRSGICQARLLDLDPSSFSYVTMSHGVMEHSAGRARGSPGQRLSPSWRVSGRASSWGRTLFHHVDGGGLVALGWCPCRFPAELLPAKRATVRRPHERSLVNQFDPGGSRGLLGRVALPGGRPDVRLTSSERPAVGHFWDFRPRAAN